jgi:hypothetical protein
VYAIQRGVNSAGGLLVRDEVGSIPFRSVSQNMISRESHLGGTLTPRIRSSPAPRPIGVIWVRSSAPAPGCSQYI